MKKTKTEEHPEAMSGELTVAEIIKDISSSGNSAHIPVSRKFLGDRAYIKIKRKYIICQRCSETFSDKKLIQEEDSRYCKKCFQALKFVKQNKGKLNCRVCGKTVSEQEYKQAWDDEICPSCWEKEAEGHSKKEEEPSSK